MTRREPETQKKPSSLVVQALVMGAGAAALSWELLWQIQTSLALGVSAVGTAVVLATTMGGMAVGALLMGRALKKRQPARPLRVYAILELAVGLAGLAMLAGFGLVEQIDAWSYAHATALSAPIHFVSIAAVLGVPTLAMGATIPVFGLVARSYRTSLSTLYAVNTAGAAVGVFAMAFTLIPALGIELVAQLAACINIAVAACAWLLPAGDAAAQSETPAEPASTSDIGFSTAIALVACTGCATFALEVAWFRSLRAAMQSTTDSFAIILISVLLPLAIGARSVPWLRRSKLNVATMLGLAGIAILAAAPLVERMDILIPRDGNYWSIVASWLGVTLAIIGVPILLLGTVLPWVLDEQQEPRDWARLYAANTLAAIAGSLIAAWALLPTIGFARSVWLVGGLVVVAAVALSRGRGRGALAVGGACVLALAIVFESGVGRTRAQYSGTVEAYEVIDFAEGPDSTVAVVERASGYRSLLIDGFDAADESLGSTYMQWMGRLPMVLHPDPLDVLVIGFGTGQTANGARNEGPDHIDIVELSPAVIGMAHHFDSNEQVLEDPRVNVVIMDGRAWLRRTERTYDVITLEPMPPNFAGVNALYSREFYELAARRLRPGGIVAQWVPYHLLPPQHATSVAATFHEALPDSILWIDPTSGTGILVGRVESSGEPLGTSWPGLARDGGQRPLPPEIVDLQARLSGDRLTAYCDLGVVVTDDNQLLAYGRFRQLQLHYGGAMNVINQDIVKHFAEP